MTSQIQLVSALSLPGPPHTQRPSPHRALLTPLIVSPQCLCNFQRAVVRLVLSAKWSAVGVSFHCNGYAEREVGNVCTGAHMYSMHLPLGTCLLAKVGLQKMF